MNAFAFLPVVGLLIGIGSWFAKDQGRYWAWVAVIVCPLVMGFCLYGMSVLA